MKRLLIVWLAVTSCLLFIPQMDATAGNPPNAMPRQLLGLQVGKAMYPRWQDGEGVQYGFTFVPRRYQGDFRNVCLYIEWKDYEGAKPTPDADDTNNRDKETHHYNYPKYEKIFKDLIDAGVESIKVCFCPFLPDWACERIYEDFTSPSRTWEPWLRGWANRYEPSGWYDESTGALVSQNVKNWWSRALFRYVGTRFELVSFEKTDKNSWPAFYRNAVHLALPEYEKMISDFATRFGKYIDFWEPWDELGWGLNFAPAGVKYKPDEKEGVPSYNQVCGGCRFSGWPGPYRSVEDGSWVEGDAQQVQAACYNAVHRVYNANRGKNWPVPCVMLSSLVGDEMLLNKTPDFFEGETNTGVQGNTSSLYYYRDNLESRDFSLAVSSNKDIVCERPFYVNLPSGYSGGGDSAGSSAPSDSWYFAEGTTREGFEEILNLFNPNKEKITVDISFMFGDGITNPKNIQIAVDGGRRKDLVVNKHVGAGMDVSARLSTANGKKFYAERTVNFKYKGAWTGTHCSVGAPAPSTAWYLAEGSTRPGFEEWLCIQNPNNRGIHVTAEYMTAGGPGGVKEYAVGAKQRLTLEVAREVGANQDVSVRLTSSKAFVAERPMYFSFENKTGGDCILGATATSRTRYFAEGCTYAWAREFLCIQNPTSADIIVTARYLPPPEQGTPFSRQYSVRAFGRRTIDVNAEVGGGKEISVCLSSDAEFLAERPFYFDIVRNEDTDNVFNGGSVCMGSGSPSRNTVFAAGGVSASSEEWLAIMNPNDKAVSVTLTYSDTAGKVRTEKKSVAPNSRLTCQVRPSFTNGIYSYCDAVGIHLFNKPNEYFRTNDKEQIKGWAGLYGELRRYLSKRSLGGMELAVTSCGWPHAVASNKGYVLIEEGAEGSKRSRAYQALALETGIQDLLSAGCKKFWIFQDIDPRTSSDGYFGLFSYDSHEPFSEDNTPPNDAWWKYREWQYRTENGKRVFEDKEKKKWLGGKHL